ncbi:MAG: invasin domain 3-containing protein, partial [Balneolaceae bacterium]
MKKIFGLLFVIGFLALQNPVKVFGQATPGLIYKPATGIGTSILDPNGDGYVSATTGGFSYSDHTESEISFMPIYQTGAEGTRDVRTGPPGGHTDLVGQYGDGKKTAFMYYDAANNALLFRVRLAKQSKASKGYSFLFNTDFEQFGPKTANFSRNNPGFQYEVVLETNFRISVYDWSSGSANRVWSSPNLDDYFQKSISYKHYGQSGDNGYFYDFYIPLDDVPTTFRDELFDDFRVTVSTITNAQRGISGVISDILGSGSLNLQSECGGGIGSLNCTEVDPTTITPDIDIPLYDGDTSISGRLQEADESTVYIFVNNIQIGTTTVTDFTWELTGITALAENDVVKVRASSTGKKISSFTGNLTVLAQGEILTCSDASIGIATDKGGPNESLTGNTVNVPTGATVADLTIRAYSLDGSTILFSTDSEDSPNTTVTNTSNDPNSFYLGNPGPNGFYSNLGEIFITVQFNGQCESELTKFNGTTTPSSAPIINSTDVITSTNTIEGTHTSGDADIYLYINDQSNQIGFLSNTNHSGTWSIDVSSVNLQNGSKIFARAKVGSAPISEQSNIVVVGEGIEPDQSEAPQIVGDYVAGSNVTVEGFSTEEAGTEIKLYIDGVLEGSTEVTIDNTWELEVASLSDGNVLTATATAPQETESEPSEGVTVLAGTSAIPEITSALTIYSPEISGTSSASGTLAIYVDDGIIGTKEISGNWTFTDADAGQGSGYVQNELYQGATVTATLTEDGKPESDYSNGVLVTGITSFSIVAEGGGNIGTQVAGTAFDIDIDAREGADGTGDIFDEFVDNVLIYSVEAPVSNGLRVTDNFTAGSVTHETKFDDGAEDVVIRALFTDNPEITGASNTFLVNNPDDVTLTSITPNTKYAGEAEFELTLTGTNFVSSSVVRVNGADRTTEFVSSTQIKATILESDIESAGELDITVISPPPQGTGGETPPITFTVEDPPILTLTNVSPDNGDQFSTQNVTLTGTNLIGNGVTEVDFGDDIVVNSTSANEDYTEMIANITINEASTELNDRNVTVTNPAPDGGSDVLEEAFTVNASEYTKFIVTAPDDSPIDNQVAGESFEIKIIAADAADFPFDGFTGQVDLEFSDGSIDPVTTGNFVDGVWTGNVTVTKAGTDLNILATNGDGTGNQTGSSNNFNVNAAEAFQYFVTVDNETPQAGTDITVTAQLSDQNGNSVATSGKTVTWSSTNLGDGSFSSATSSTNSNGVATVTFTTSSTEGTDHKISATDGDGNTGQSSTITTTSAPPTKIVYISAEKTTTAGISTSLIAIELQDGNDNTRAATSNTTITLSSNSGTGVFRNQNNTGTVSQITIPAGVSSVSFRYRDTKAGIPEITADNDAFTSASQNVTIKVGAFNAFEWNLNSPQTNDVAFAGTNTLTITDQYGNIITDFDASVNPVTISTAGDLSSGDISGLDGAGNDIINQAGDFTNGVADLTVLGLTYTGPVGTGKLHSISGIVTSNSSDIEITAGTATKILVETANDGSGEVMGEQMITSGDTITVYAIARDASNNFVELIEDATWSLSEKTGVTDEDLVDNEDGSATFAGNVIGSAVINADSTGLTATPSGTITVEHGDAAKLAIATQPAGGASGDELTTQPVIEIQDAAGNVITDDNATEVSVAILSGNDGTLGGTTTATAENGIATFADLALAGTVSEDYKLQFSATELDPADSDPINLSAGLASQMTVSTQPEETVAGDTINGMPAVTITDSEGNAVSGIDVTVSINKTAFANGTFTQFTNASGIAEFNDLILDTADTGYQLTFNADVSGVDDVNSNNFDITPAAANQMVITQQPNPSTGNNNGSATSVGTVILQTQDEFGNASTIGLNAEQNVTVSLGTDPTSGAAVFAGTLTKDLQSGTAAFDDLTLDKDGTGFTLTFTSSSPVGLGTVISDPFNMQNVEDDSGFDVALAEAGNKTAGENFALDITNAIGADGNDLTGEINVTVTSDQAQDGEVFNVDVNFTAGSATLPGIKLTLAVVHQLNVDVTGVTSDKTVEVTVDPAPANAANSAITANPETITANGDDLSLVTITVKDEFENIRTAGGDDIFVETDLGSLSLLTDNENGTYTANLTGTTTGTATINGFFGTDNEGDSIGTAEVTLVAGAPAQISLSGPADVTAGEESGNFTLTVLDAQGNETNINQDTEFTLASQDEPGTASFSPAPVIISNGSSTGTFTYTNTKLGDGTHAIEATWNSGGDDLGSATSNIDVTAGELENFLVEKTDGGDIENQTAGESFAIKITARDANNNTLSGFTGTVNLSLNKSDLESGGGETAAFENGILNSHSIRIDTADTGYQISVINAGAGTEFGTSNSFDVNAAAASKLAITLQPAGGTGSEDGTPAGFGNVELETQDAFGNPSTVGLDTEQLVTVSLAVDASENAAALGGTKTLNIQSGTATYSDLTLNRDGAGYQLLFISELPVELDPITSDLFNMSGVEDVSGFDVALAEVGNKTAGVGFDLEITNAKGTNGENLEGEISVTVTSNHGQDDEIFNDDFTFTNGSATLSNAILTLADDHTLTIKVTGITGSETVEVTLISAPANAANSAITANPETITADGEDASVITITLYDEYGNLRAAGGDNVFAETDSGTLGTFTDNEDGTYSANLTGTTSGTAAISGFLGTDNEGDSIDTVEVTLEAGAPSTMLFTTSEQTITAGQNSSNITLELRDALNNTATAPEGGIVFDVSTDGAGEFRNTSDEDEITSVTIAENQSGISFRYYSETAGTDELTAADQNEEDGVGDASQSITIQAGAISVAETGSLLSGTDLNRIADGEEEATITLQLRDEFGNNIEEENVSVIFDATGGDLSTANTTTNAAGQASATLSSTTAGIFDITAKVDDSDNGTADADVTRGSPVQAVFAAGDITKVAFTTQPENATAGSTLNNVVVQLLDANDNVVETADIDISVTISDGTTLNGTKTVATVENGTATFSTLSVTEAGDNYTLTASVDGADPVITKNSDTFDITVAEANTANSTITANPETITADGEDASVITITLYDEYGNLRAAGGDNIFAETDRGTLGTLSDNEDGTYTANLTGNTAGTATISGYLGTDNEGALIGTAEVVMEAGAAAKITVTPASRSITAGERVSFEIIRFDENDNEVTAGELTVNLTGDSDSGDFFAGEVGGSEIASIDIADENSSITVWYTDTNSSETTPYDLTFNAGAGDLTQTAQITGISPNTANQITLAGPNEVTVGEVSEVFTITVLDAYGNETLTTLSTTFSLTTNTSGTGSYYSDSEGNSALAGNEITIGAGEGTAEFYYSDTEVNTGTVVTATQTTGDDIGSDSHSIDINSTNATKLAIADLTDPITAGTLGSFKVQIHDADDEQTPASGDITVNLSSDQAEGRFYTDADDFDSENPATNAISEITISQGDTQAELWYYGTSAGNHELTAEDNGEDLNSAAEITSVISANAAGLALTANPSSPVAGSNSTITAVVTDAFGNPIENEDVDFSIENGNGSFGGTFSGVSTNAAGEAAAVYQTSTTVETADLQAELNEDAAISDEISITSVAGDAAKYILTVSDETPEAGSEITVNAQLSDENDNAISDQGRTVNWSSNNGGSFASNSSQTNESGIAEIIFTVSGTSEVTQLITATDDVDSDITGTKSVTTNAGEVTQFTLSGPGDVEAGEVSTIFTITLQDSEGNTTTAGTGGITFNLSSTDSDAALFYEDEEGVGTLTTIDIAEGESSEGFYYSNELAGEKTLTAADNNEDDGLGSKTAQITVNPSDLHEFTVSGIVDPTTAGNENSVTVTALDEYGNTKTDYTGTITFTSSDGEAGLYSDYTFIVGDNGVKTFTDEIILRTAGEQWVQAADADKTGRQEDITVNPAEVDVSKTNTKLVIITNNVEANGTAEAEVRATLLDEFSNPIPGTSVTFSADGDAQIEDATGTTNQNGQITVAITNTTAEEVNVTALYGDGNTSIINGSPAEVTFVNGAAAKLAFVQNPSNAIAGDTLSPAITVQLLDALDNPVDTDNVEITLSISDDATLVGTLFQNSIDGLATFDDLYVIELGENYTLSAVSESLDLAESSTFNITRRSITITSEGKSKTYGDDDPELTYEITSGTLIPDFDLSGELGRSAGEDVNTYAITQNTLTNANNGSYDITFESDNLEITPRDLSLSNFTASDKTYDGTPTASGITFDDSRIEGDDIDFDFTAAFEDADAGEDKTVNISGISISGGEDAANYNLLTASAEATVDIHKKELTAEFTTSHKTYDGTTTAAIESRSVTGEVDGDDVELTGGTAAFGDQNVGTEKTVTLTGATLSGDDAHNYTLSEDAITTTADISEKALTITAEDKSKAYDGSAFTA